VYAYYSCAYAFIFQGVFSSTDALFWQLTLLFILKAVGIRMFVDILQGSPKILLLLSVEF
jgi:hypothetical protein